MKRKYVLFSDDIELCGKLQGVFSVKELTCNPAADFFGKVEPYQLAIIDGDTLPPRKVDKELKGLIKKKIPVVFVFGSVDGKEVMRLLDLGVLSVMFKDSTAKKLEKELKGLLFHVHYLDRVKELAANEARIKKLLDVAKALTSNNDINDIMFSILDAMRDAFNLESIAFFLSTKGKLKRKVQLGEERIPASTGEHWEIDNGHCPWLNDIRKKAKPYRITKRSPNFYREQFRENTLLLPLVIKEKFLGVIAAIPDASSTALSKNEMTLLDAFGEQTAVALENARLYWDVIKAREELILQEKKSFLGQIILSLNHEINNPLSIISMEAQLLQQRMSKKEDKIEARLTNIEHNIERIKVILDTISSLNVEDQLTTEYAAGRFMLNLQNGH